MAPLTTGLEVRLAARTGTLTRPTVGLAPSHLQANLIVLPQRYAADFRILCARNPVPCPLLAESATPGAFDSLVSHLHSPSGTVPVAADIDLRRDAPRYRVYRNGKLDTQAGREPAHVADLWQPDHVGFLIGCSFSFEAALVEDGLAPLYLAQGRNVPMYRTSIPLCPAGVFTGGTYVVSMRAYRAADIERVRDITRRFGATHGEPVMWGWDAVARLGIRNIAQPEWGDPPLDPDGASPFSQQDDGLVPVFWGCGVTPQEAVMRANLNGTVIGHAPGHMVVLDLKDQDVFS